MICVIDDQICYRCYVLETFPETDKMELFFCDYGNFEMVNRSDFRPTYSDSWQLPPQAVPCKISGMIVFQLQFWCCCASVFSSMIQYRRLAEFSKFSICQFFD